MVLASPKRVMVVSLEGRMKGDARGRTVTSLHPLSPKKTGDSAEVQNLLTALLRHHLETYPRGDNSTAVA
jgi:hypothetical protein